MKHYILMEKNAVSAKAWLGKCCTGTAPGKASNSLAIPHGSYEHRRR